MATAVFLGLEPFCSKQNEDMCNQRHLRNCACFSSAKSMARVTLTYVWSRSMKLICKISEFLFCLTAKVSPNCGLCLSQTTAKAEREVCRFFFVLAYFSVFGFVSCMVTKTNLADNFADI